MKKMYTQPSFRDYEDIPKLNVYQRAQAHTGYLNYLKEKDFMNYRLLAISGCGPEIELAENGYLKKGSYISFVCNDYLGFTQLSCPKKTVKFF